MPTQTLSSLSNSLLPLPSNTRHGSNHFANQNVNQAINKNNISGSTLIANNGLSSSSSDNNQIKQNFFQEILSYIPETQVGSELFKSLIKLCVAFVAYKSAPWFKDRFVQAKLTNKLKVGIQSKANEIGKNSKIQYYSEFSKETWEKQWDRFGYKFNLKDFLPDPIAFFSDPIVLLAGGYVGGSALFGILSQFLPTASNDLDKDATHNQAEANNKKTHSRNLFQKFFDALVKLGVAGLGLHWMGKKFNHNPIAELIGLVGGFGLGQLINAADEWLTNKIENFVKPIINSITGRKEEVQGPSSKENFTNNNWSFSNAIAGAISLSLLFFIKFLILIPKKKALVYKFSFEPNKGIKNEGLRSTLKLLHAQASLSGSIFGLKLGTILPEPPELDRAVLPATNLEKGIHWFNQFWPLTKEHIDKRVEEMKIPGFTKPLMKLSAKAFCWSYLKKISLWGEAIRCKHFSEIMESSANPDKSSIAQAMIKDSQNNILAKALLMPFIASIIFTTDLFANFLINPFIEFFKSLFGLDAKEIIIQSPTKPSLSQQIQLAENHR